MNEIERFKIWKLRVKQECKRCRWPKSLIQTIDWEAWRIQFYDDGMTPEEAVECEMDCMMQNG